MKQLAEDGFLMQINHARLGKVSIESTPEVYFTVSSSFLAIQNFRKLLVTVQDVVVTWAVEENYKWVNNCLYATCRDKIVMINLRYVAKLTALVQIHDPHRYTQSV